MAILVGGRLYEDFKPRSEWKQDSGSHILIIYLPGFDKDCVKITIRRFSRIIVVSGARRMEDDDRSRRFQVEFRAPETCNLNGARAKFEDDAVIITIPKINVEKYPQLPDPDGGSSSLCSACTLPIFSTPFVSVGDELYLHDQCANPPEILPHELHPDHGALALVNNPIHNPTTTCQNPNCNQVCGTMFYQCPIVSCGFRLDMLCALQIKILHRSHAHRLMAIRLSGSASLTCNACDTKHEPLPSQPESDSESISYLCNLCRFWIHTDCASLPNPILHYLHHDHCLFLTYKYLPTAADAKCMICSDVPKRTSGVYFCLNCPNYLVHIRCAIKFQEVFKPVFIRDAKVADLGRLPLPDEHTSLVPYLRENATSEFHVNLHPHDPLILHEADDGSRASGVCNACVQSVSPPFFSCPDCPDFFLHKCCAYLPKKIQHRAHEQHPLLLSPKAPNSDISAGFTCKGCDLRCNGFAYSCKTCDNFSMDVGCALINPAITHESHNNTHILFMCRDVSFGSDEKCNCCRSPLKGICYECSICRDGRNFKLHVRCALLTNYVEHVLFDRHPLQLTTISSAKSDTSVAAVDGDEEEEEDEELCEVCEEYIEREPWYYSCSDCNQSFHVDCIPSVDRFSRIKLGSTVQVDGHDCPLTLTRQGFDGCGGLRCGLCGEDFKFSDDGLAYECCKCFTMIHHTCVVNSVLNR